MFEVRLYQRDFSGGMIPAGVEVVPLRWSAHRVGGYDAASLRVTGDVWSVLGWLRRPVEILGPAGVVVWSGYVSEASVQAGAVTVGASLDTLANEIKVTYTDVPAGETTGSPATTSSASSEVGIAEFGQRSALLGLGQAETATAESYRDAMLTLRKYPRSVITVGAAQSGEAWLECRGWWHTLDWLYYTNGGTTGIETTAQILAMVANYLATNDWFLGCDIVSASSVTGNQYRDGTRTHKEEIEDLLVMGTSAGERLRAWVDVSRWVRVEAESEPTVPSYQLGEDGGIYSTIGMAVHPGLVTVAGDWLGLRDVLPGVVPSTLSGLSPMQVERCEYDGTSGQYTIEPGGVSGPWAILNLG